MYTLPLKKYKSLQLEADIELDIITIHAQIPPHFMAWCLDDTFSSIFVRQPELFSVSLPKDTESNHVEYYWNDVELSGQMWLIENKGDKGFLYAPKPRPDFWILMKNMEERVELENWIKKIQSISTVQTAYIFPKSKHGKLFWLKALSHL
ncbi:MAG: hypothetical protein CK532_04045 [Flavobacteriales bacterium]|nr:MAG: hypothetical protein CK532_04045 [Flavobacteriales bacterium]